MIIIITIIITILLIIIITPERCTSVEPMISRCLVKLPLWSPSRTSKGPEDGS